MREERGRGGKKKPIREVSTFTNDNAAPHLPAALALERICGGQGEPRDEIREQGKEPNLKTQGENNLGSEHWTVAAKMIKISKQATKHVRISPWFGSREGKENKAGGIRKKHF